MQTSTSTKKATSMADLMKKVAAAKTPFVSPHKGDMLTGTITKLTSGEILVDINAKTEAVVLEKERQIMNKILTSYKVGDKVAVQVLNPESDFGYPVVSLRRSVGDITWDRLAKLQKSQEPVEVNLDMATKGGFLVTTSDGISGFLPNSHTSSLENPQGLIGRKIKVIVLENNRELNKIIFSQKQAMGPADFQKLIKDLKVGQKIDAVVSNVAPFGVFLSIAVDDTKLAEGTRSELGDNITGLIKKEKIPVKTTYKEGQEVNVTVSSVDKKKHRVEVAPVLTAKPIGYR